MKWLWTVVLLVMAMARISMADGPKVQVQACPTTQPAVYDRLEWTVKLDRSYDNPFDPDQIAVDALFSGPEGRMIELPAFWHQEFREHPRRPLYAYGSGGEPHWRIRFAPPAAGQWRLVVRARDAQGVGSSAVQQFDVPPSTRRGFVRRSTTSGRYLQYDDGSPCFWVGLNLGWSRKPADNEYPQWIGQLADAGGNFARIWMCGTNPNMESGKLGPGRYDLAGCAFYDRLLELADQRGIGCMLTFNNYRLLLVRDSWGPAEWPGSPYNAAHGGPATRPAEFFTHEGAKKLFRQRLRYLVGRYSAFTSLACWEFWNEQDLTAVKDTAAWTAEMAAYLKRIDPYRHLVSTSYAMEPDPAVWKLPEIDLVQRHQYGDREMPMSDSAAVVAMAMSASRPFGKPALMGEIGICAWDSDIVFDPAGLGAHLHNSLWAGALSGSAGSACAWYWDNYVHVKNLWPHYAALARYVAQVDWPRRQFEPLAVPSPVVPVAGEERFTDLVIPAAGNWGRHLGEPLQPTPDGSHAGHLPRYFYGPAKPDLRQPVELRLDFPRPTRLAVRVVELSDKATLSIAVDGKPLKQFPLDARPGSPGVKKSTFHPEYNNIHQATMDCECAVEIPAGRHAVAIDIIDGDWIAISRLTLGNAISSRFTGLRPLALDDAKSGEILLWMYDPSADWSADKEGKTPRRFERASLELPAQRDGDYSVAWWDTRTGKPIRQDTATARDGKLRLEVPAFERDIALKAAPAR